MMARPGEMPGEMPGDITERRALALLVTAVVVGKLGMDHMPWHVPFVAGLDRLASASAWMAGLDALWVVGIALVVLPWWRIGSLLAGSAELMRVLGNMALFSNGRTLDALVLILAGLTGPRIDNRLLRVQYLLLYVGASLNKFLDAHWRDGSFVLATLSAHLSPTALGWWTPLAPLAGWITMGVEFLIPLLLLRESTRRVGVLLVLAFHTGLLIMLNEDFGTFYYTVAIGAILLFYPFPRVRALRMPARWRWLAERSCLSVFRAARPVDGPFDVTWGHHRARGALAVATLGATCLPIVTSGVLLLTSLHRIGSHRLREAAILLVIGGAGVLWGATHPAPFARGRHRHIA